jgi:hypothetical protein
MTARGTVSVPGAAKVYRLRGVSVSAAAGVPQKLALKMPRKAQTAVRRALEKRKRVRANINVRAVDAAGNSTLRRRTVRVVKQ